jgi:hypothetical protein
MSKYIRILPLLFLFSCSAKEIEIIDNSVIFKSSENEFFHAENSFDIRRFYGLRTDWAHDGITGIFWLHTVIDNRSEFCVLNVDGSTSKSLLISYDNVVPSTGGGFFVSNNIAFISAKTKAGRICLLVDLTNCTYKQYNIEKLLYREIMGFSNEIIFGDRWFYNVETTVLSRVCL